MELGGQAGNFTSIMFFFQMPTEDMEAPGVSY